MSTLSDKMNVLMPHMENERSRKAVVGAALYGCNVLAKIEWGGNQHDFTIHLIQELDRFGDCVRGEPALVTLLKYIRNNYVGTNKYDEIDQLVARLMPTTKVELEVGKQFPASAPKSTSYKWDVFISYQRDAEAEANEVFRRLTQAGLNVWQDLNNIRHTSRWSQAIQEGLEQSERLVLLLTPQAVSSQEVYNEWFYFYNENKPIHCLMLLECKPHYQLRPYQYLDWRNPDGRDWNRLLKEIGNVFTSPVSNMTSSREHQLETLRESLNRLGATDDFPDWVTVPTGTFTYGDTEIDAPEGEMSLDGFLIARTPITQQQYLYFVIKSGHRDPYSPSGEYSAYNWQNGRPPQQLKDHPVVLVSASDAEAYCHWLTQVYRDQNLLPDGWRVTLPAEYEWEYAARGTDGRRYAWPGGQPDDLTAHIRADGTGSVTGQTNGASPFGALHMIGNIWEWTRSEENGERILRGSSWLKAESDETYRAAFRYTDSENTLDFAYGFRVVIIFTK